MTFAHSTACPRCRANGRDRRGDNLAMYDDGGGYCFSCSFLIPSKHRPMIKEEENEDDLSKFEKNWTNEFPKATLEWFAKYNLTSEEIKRFSFNPLTNRHVFPVYNNNKLVFFEERNVLGVVPKSICRGTRQYLVNNPGLLDPRNPHICVVEDIISAIKVSRQMASVCLFGSVLPEHFLPDILRNKVVHVWLDYDKFKDGVAIANRLNNMGLTARAIQTKYDPKELSSLSIMKALHII